MADLVFWLIAAFTIVSALVVVLNKNEFKVYDSVHIRKWGVFENYFKAGNYFQSRDDGSFSKVKLYELDVSHDWNYTFITCVFFNSTNISGKIEDVEFFNIFD